MVAAIALEATIIVLLVLINGALAMSEMAIVSSRKIRLQRLAENGSRGARTALEMAGEPSNFLASVQIGITLIGILAGAFGGATIADQLATSVGEIPLLAPYADPISLGIVVLAVTFLSLIFGELVPKRIAMTHAESVASALAPPLRVVSVLARPAVRVLSAVTEGVVKILGLRQIEEAPVTEEEFKTMIDQGAASGVLDKEEGSMMKRALEFGDRRVAEIMTPRHQLVALDLDASLEDNLARVRAAPHSYFPVYRGTADHLAGVVSNKRIIEAIVSRRSFDFDLNECLIEPLFVMETMSTLKLLERFKSTGTHLALVIDEYGTTAGIVTLTDLMEAIVGDLPTEEDISIVRREDGSLLLEGTLPLYELEEVLNITIHDGELEGDFQTLGGLAMEKLGNIPRTGDVFEWKNHRFEIVDMDGRRVDKVLVMPSQSETPFQA